MQRDIFSLWVGSSHTPRLLREFRVSVCPAEYSHINARTITASGKDILKPLFMNTAQAFKLRAAGALRCLNACSGCVARDRWEPAPHPAFFIAQDCHTCVILTSPPSPRRPSRI